MSAFYTLPVWKPVYDFSFFLMALLTVLLCLAAAFFACRKVLRLSPAETLRAAGVKKIRRTLLEKTRVWHKLGFNLQWNLRDMSRNTLRCAMAAAGALGCSALLICAFSMRQDMNDLKVWQYEQINRYETKLVLEENIDAERLAGVLAETDGAPLLEGAVEIRSAGAKYTGSLTVADNTPLIKFTDKSRKIFEPARGSVYISYKMADMLNVKAGDKIEWHLFAEEGWKECVIAGVYRHPTMQGLFMDTGVYSDFYGDFSPTSVVTAKTVESPPDGVKTLVHKNELTSGWDELTESMMLMVFILIAAAIALAVVVLYNLGLLSFTEMEREMATLKVVGLKSSKLRLLLLTQNLILSFFGYVLGIPCGWLLVKIMIKDMGDAFDMIAALHAADFIFTFLIVVAVSLVINLLFSKKIKRIDMVSSLKSGE
jgi:putative ABC transport system permease protein